MATKSSYTLTLQAEADLIDAEEWSFQRWGVDLTKAYMNDLHQGANYVASNYSTFNAREDLTADTGLSIYPVREHYLVYIPYKKNHIIIAAVIRQGRNVPSILSRNSFEIQHQLDEIKQLIADGMIKL